jgi:autotransporter-associated beta strand protein
MENMPSVDGAFTKAGSNTLTLGGNSTYTGGTTVSAGGLLVTGSLGESAVSVGAGARFGGTGSVGGSVHFDSLASLEIVDLFDPLLIAGNVSFGSGFGFGNLIGFDVETVAPGTYTLLAGSNFNLGGLNHVDLANAFTRADGKQAYFQNGSLQVVVIPEPSSFLLGIVSVLGLMRRQRSHGGA